MTTVSGPDGGDIRRVSRGRQPVVDRGSNSPALDRRVPGPRMAGDQQDHTLAGLDRPFERQVDRAPCAVEIVAVEVDDPVGSDGPRLELAVPCPVEGGAGPRPGRLRRWSARNSESRAARLSLRRLLGLGLGFRGWSARQRADGRSYPCPQLGLFRVERAHVPRCPWEAGSAPDPKRTFRRRFGSPPARRPRTCRSGWAP